MSNKLWTDERIRDEVQKYALVMGTRQPEPFVLSGIAIQLMRQIRDDAPPTMPLPDEVRAAIETLLSWREHGKAYDTVRTWLHAQGKE